MKGSRKAHREQETTAHTLILSAPPPFRNLKEWRLLLPWSLPHTPVWLSNLSLFREGGLSFWGTSLLCSPFAWQSNKATLSFSITLPPYFCLAVVHRQPRFWQHFLHFTDLILQPRRIRVRSILTKITHQTTTTDSNFSKTNFWPFFFWITV